MPVSDAVDTLGGVAVTRLRAAVGGYMNGYWQAGTPVTDAITCSIQPMTGRDLQVLPEGQRADEVQVFYSTSELRTREPQQWDADTLLFAGVTWRVIRVKTWAALGATYYRALVAKVTPSGSVAALSAVESGDHL